MIGKTWPWWQLWLGVKPKLRSTKFAEIKASLEAKTAEAEKKKEQEKQARQKAAVINEQVRNLVDKDLPILLITIARSDPAILILNEFISKFKKYCIEKRAGGIVSFRRRFVYKFGAEVDEPK